MYFSNLEYSFVSVSLCSSSVRSAPSLTIHTGFLARYILAAAIHPHGERSGHRALSIALLQKFHFWHFPKKKDRSRFYISSLKLFLSLPRHRDQAKPLPRFRGLLRPLYCITRGGYSSVQFGTVRHNRKTPRHGGASLATGSISLL